MKLAIHYSAVRTPLDSSRLFGVQVAVQGWLKAYFQHGKQEKIPFLIGDEASLNEVKSMVAELGLAPERVVPLDARFPRENLGGIDVVFRADSDPHDLLWQRAYAPEARFAFCGLAHAIAGREGGALLEKYALHPSAAGDAIVCPSRAIRDVIASFWDFYGAFIAKRFGGRFQSPVALPLIPLGMDTQGLAAKITPANRAAIRAALGVNDSDTVVLWVGRLSAAIKAHPLPMLQAVERAAQRTGRRVHFVMQGYYVPETAKVEFAALARDIAQTATVHFVAPDDARFPNGLWAGGDIFLSLVDNMQESFGLTPLEAIIAGLPRVLSDWDGYRETATHGVDALMVPTFQPPPGTGDDLAALVLNTREMYGGFLAKTAQSVAVDAESAAQHLCALIQNLDLARSLATKAKERLREHEWRAIIPRYENLWEELAAQRGTYAKDWPAIPAECPDPFAWYKSYPTASLTLDDKVRLVAAQDEIKRLWAHGMNVLACDQMIGGNDIAVWLNEMARGSAIPISKLFASVNADPARQWRTLGWLLKLGILRREG